MDMTQSQTFPIDDKYQRAIAFAKNKHSSGIQHAGISNLYVIQKTDIDGNVIDEYFGENLFTDYGMSQYLISNVAFPTSIFVGRGMGGFDKSSNILLDPIVTTSTTKSSTTKSYEYPLYYDNTSGIITCTCKYLECYLDYTVAGLTENTIITEYGIGAAYNQLWTHSWVYDISGAQTTITKKLNERLTFTVFLCFSYNESLIVNNWNNGIYTVITSMQRFFDNKMYEASAGTFKRDIMSPRTVTHISSGFMNDSVSRHTIMSDTILYNDSTDTGDYIGGFYQKSPGFLVIERQEQSIPETFEFINYPSDNCDIFSLSNAVGIKDHLPMCQIKPASVNMFDYLNNSWTNMESFTGNENRWYCDDMMTSSNCGTQLYYTNKDTVQSMLVYLNINTNDPIVSLNNTGLETVYVTDKYWDTSSWILLTNYQNIPESLQTKHYWITPSDSQQLKFVRGSSSFDIIPQQGGIQNFQSINKDTYANTYGDSTYGWYIHGGTVYIPSNKTNFTVAPTTYMKTYSYDKWMITYSNESNKFYVTDMSDLTTIPTPTVCTYKFPSRSMSPYSDLLRTESGTGLFCLSDNGYTHKYILLDVRNDSINYAMHDDANIACCIWGTNKLAIIPTSNPSVINIYDVDTQTIAREITIPSGFTVNFICGHSKYVWISDNSSRTIVCNIETGTVTDCYLSAFINMISNGRQEMTCLDDMFIVYNSYTSSADNGCLIRIDDPNTIVKFTDLMYYDSSTSDISINIRRIHGGTLVLLISQSIRYNVSVNTVADLGLYLKTNVPKYYRCKSQSYILYGDFIINESSKCVPIDFYMPMKITGSTKTISAINTIKRISEKGWIQQITNTPSFYGMPPGNAQ